jgi:cytochrome oxidase assembly protein ShyY1
MRSGGRSSFGAAKLLLDRGWLDKEAASQAKRKLQEKEEEEMNKEALLTLNEDAERLGLNKLN